MADKRISQLIDRGTVVNNDVIPIVVSGAVTTNKATISSIQTFMQANLDVGVTSVGITLGSSGTDVNASGSPVTSSGNITINLPTASAVNRGALSSADWTTFNSKQQAITLTTTGTSGASTLVSGTLNIPNYSTDLSGYVTLGTVQTITAQKTFTTSGGSDSVIISTTGAGFALDAIKAGNGEVIRVNKTSGSGNAMTVIGGNFEAPTIVKTGGTSSQFLKADGSIDSTAYTTNTGTVTSVGLSSATSGVTIGSTPITTSGTITLAIATASGSQNGLLSSTDWTTFNGKQNALTNPVTGTGVNERVALWNGTSSINSDSDFTYNSTSNLLTIGGGITLTGAQTIQTSTGNLTLATAGGNGNILITPNGTGKVGIGTITPEGSGLTVASGGILVSLDPGVDRKVLELYATSTGAKVSSSYVGASSYGSLELLTSNVARLTIASTGAATFSSSVADYGATITNIQDASQGLLIRATDNDTSLYLLNLQSSNTTTGQTWVDRFVVNKGGSVGIGTASPDRNLEVETTSDTYLRVTGNRGNADGVHVGNLEFYNSNTSRIVGEIRGITGTGGTQSNSGQLAFFTNDAGTYSERMRITSAGNVGIGTASPTMSLTIKGDKQGDANEGQGQLLIEGNSAYNATNGSILSSSGAGSVIIFKGKYNAAGSFTGLAGISGSKENTTDGNYGGNLRFYTRTNGVDDQAEQMRITSQGNIVASITGKIGFRYSSTDANLYSYLRSATNSGIGPIVLCGGFESGDGSNEAIRLSTNNGSGGERTALSINNSGSVTIAGALSKGSGSFKIDHPLPSKKNTHHLVHSFIEGPQADNIYRGIIDLVDGYAEVNIDETSGMTEGTFIVLNGNIQCFTSNESGWAAIRGKVEGNILKIEAQDLKCVDTISWLVIGERIDQHMIDTDWTDENGKVIVEPLKKIEKESEILNEDLQNQNQTEDESNA